MTNDLIVRLTACAMLLLVAACCDDDDKDCTQSELMEKRAREAAWNTPALVAVKDGVKVYCLHCGSFEDVVYFTTPCGDTSWTKEERHGKTTDYIPKHANGHGCDQ